MTGSPAGSPGSTASSAGAPDFAPTLESLRTHQAPDWYRDAKLGIFIHWSVPSVPGFAPRDHEINDLLREHYDDLMPRTPYAEWYENSLRFPWSEAARHHLEHHGDRPYIEFQRDFEAGLAHWNPDAWAGHFAAAGARYVVMVTKHHDGYCLWPSRVRNPHRAGWHCPRNLVAELAQAVRARGMRFGVYYSGGIDWSFNPTPVRNLLEFVASMPTGDYPDYADAQVRELIETIAPDVLWNDISWPTSQEFLWRLFADYYAAVPEGLVNDRWLCEGRLIQALRIRPIRALANWALKRQIRKPGHDFTPPPPPHYDTRTPEYAVFPNTKPYAWESVRGMDKSFGFNRNSRPEDFLGHDELIHSLVDIASKNGNLLLNVGPRGEDAQIPDRQLERLRWLGEFLDRSGEALYGTRSWQRPEGETVEGIPLRFTARGDALYAIALGTPTGTALTLRNVPSPEGAEVTCLGSASVKAVRQGADLRIEFSAPLDPASAHAFRIAPSGVDR
jgi:alpha-L-fucosidase